MTRKCEKSFIGIHHDSTRMWLTAILLLSFLLKLLCWGLEPTVSKDGCFYIRIAQLWYEIGDFPTLYKTTGYIWFPPLPSYLMKTLMRLGFSAEEVGVALNLALGTFTPLIFYAIALEVTQRKDIAISSALLAAVNPTLCQLASQVQRDMVYLFFIGLTLWLLAAGVRRQERKFWCGAGLACGCAILARFESLEFLVIVPAVLLIQYITKYLSLKKSLILCGIFYFSFFGSMVALSFLMNSQNELWQNYKKYFMGKMERMEYHLDLE